MARFMLSVFGPAERTPFGPYASKEEMLAAFATTGAFNAMLERDGPLVHADGLQPATTAATVDARREPASVTDGPFLRSPEHLGGFWIVEAAGMAEATRLAELGSRACRGAVEVRPFQTEESVAEMLREG